MTTVELRKNQILCMLKVDKNMYSEEELETILQIGKIVYSLKEMENILNIDKG